MCKLCCPIKDGVITQRFNEKSARDSSHMHGALDLGAPVGTPILAPEDGYIFGWQSIRPKEQQYWPESPKVHDCKGFTFCNYFYDMYGGVTFLEAANGKRTHVFCHSYANQIFNRTFDHKQKFYVEQKEDGRFPLLAFYTEKVKVKRGDVIGYTGHAGYNLGAHLHWEIHPGLNNWQTYEKRIDPEKFI